MKRAYLILLAMSFLAASATAQERPRYFDNFDTKKGVTVLRTETPVSQPTVTSKKLVKKTAQSKARANDAYAAKERSAAQLRMIMASGSSMKGFTTGDMKIDSYIVDSSRRYSIDPLLIYAQMHQESSFKLRATSYKGASGLMQLMPATARRLGVKNIYEPRENIDGGVKYMRMLLDMFGQDVSLALAGYNAGEGAVMKYGNRIPPYNETQEYVRRISSRYSSITNPNYIRTAIRVNNNELAKLEQKESKPLTVFEQNAVAIRMADGRMRLVNQ